MVVDWSVASIRALRDAMRLSGAEFADRLGVSERQVGRWIHATSDLNLRPLTKGNLDILFDSLSEAEKDRFHRMLDSGSQTETVEHSSIDIRQLAQAVVHHLQRDEASLYYARGWIPDVFETQDQPPRLEREDDVNRQEFLRAMAASVAGIAIGNPAAEAVGRAIAGDEPARVGQSDVSQVNHAIDLFGDWQDLYGGGACRDAIAGQIKWATNLLRAEATEDVRDDLHRSVGFLVDVAGWGAFDAGDHQRARQYFKLALYCAEQADDWGLRANVLSDMARQAIYLGHTDEGLSLIELAQVRQDRHTATVRAMLSTVHAHALAKLSRTRDSFRAVQSAEDSFSNQNPANDPAWIQYFDAADLAGDTGHALVALALKGEHVADARSRLESSIDSYSASQARARAFSLGKLAVIDLTVGDPEQGVIYGGRALEAEAPLKSRRAYDDLHQIRQALTKRSGVDGSGELLAGLDRVLTDSERA